MKVFSSKIGSITKNRSAPSKSFNFGLLDEALRTPSMPTMSLIGPHSWNGSHPFGTILAEGRWRTSFARMPSDSRSLQKTFGNRYVQYEAALSEQGKHRGCHRRRPLDDTPSWALEPHHTVQRNLFFSSWREFSISSGNGKRMQRKSKNISQEIINNLGLNVGFEEILNLIIKYNSFQLDDKDYEGQLECLGEIKELCLGQLSAISQEEKPQSHPLFIPRSKCFFTNQLSKMNLSPPRDPAERIDVPSPEIEERKGSCIHMSADDVLQEVISVVENEIDYISNFQIIDLEAFSEIAGGQANEELKQPLNSTSAKESAVESFFSDPSMIQSILPPDALLNNPAELSKAIVNATDLAEFIYENAKKDKCHKTLVQNLVHSSKPRMESNAKPSLHYAAILSSMVSDCGGEIKGRFFNCTYPIIEYRSDHFIARPLLSFYPRFQDKVDVNFNDNIYLNVKPQYASVVMKWILNNITSLGKFKKSEVKLDIGYINNLYFRSDGIILHTKDEKMSAEIINLILAYQKTKNENGGTAEDYFENNCLLFTKCVGKGLSRRSEPMWRKDEAPHEWGDWITEIIYNLIRNIHENVDDFRVYSINDAKKSILAAFKSHRIDPANPCRNRPWN